MDQSISLLQEIVRAARDGAEGISLVMDCARRWARKRSSTPPSSRTRASI